jgi:hypothetical protein
METGGHPIVELFYPSAETGEAPVPWAERNGVQRSRRIPRLRCALVPGEPIDALLGKMMSALVLGESTFLEPVNDA